MTRVCRLRKRLGGRPSFAPPAAAAPGTVDAELQWRVLCPVRRVDTWSDRGRQPKGELVEVAPGKGVELDYVAGFGAAGHHRLCLDLLTRKLVEIIGT